MSGHYRMHRRWMDHPAFGKEPFTRAQAWCWLIEKAAWKDHTQPLGKDIIPVHRGEYATSVRFLAEQWRWSRMKAQRFLTRLEDHEMIKKTGTVHGTANGTQYTLIMVCNYDKYQVVGDEGGTPNGTVVGTRAGRGRDKLEEGYKKEEKREKNEKYVFEGKVVRLTKPDFDEWVNSFKHIRDMVGVLRARDEFLATRPEKDRKNWFMSTASYLANRNEKAAREASEPPGFHM